MLQSRNFGNYRSMGENHDVPNGHLAFDHLSTQNSCAFSLQLLCHYPNRARSEGTYASRNEPSDTQPRNMRPASSFPV